MLYPMVAEEGFPTGSELAAVLREVAARLESLGDVPISSGAVIRDLELEISERNRRHARSS